MPRIGNPELNESRGINGRRDYAGWPGRIGWLPVELICGNARVSAGNGLSHRGGTGAVCSALIAFEQHDIDRTAGSGRQAPARSRRYRGCSTGNCRRCRAIITGLPFRGGEPYGPPPQNIGRIPAPPTVSRESAQELRSLVLRFNTYR